MIVEYSKKNRIAQDKYYTGKGNATVSFSLLDKWIKELKLKDVVIVDPAAGDGKLMDAVIDYPVLGFDLFPEREDIVKNDFLENYEVLDSNSVVFMNPPFGNRGKLCKEFIANSLEFCDLVGCIVPNSFVKVKKNILNKEYQVLDYIKLDSKDFTILEEEYEVNTFFLIISRPQKKYPAVTEIVIEDFTPETETEIPTHKDFVDKIIPAMVADYKFKLEEKLYARG